MDRATAFFNRHDPITTVEFIIALFGVVGSILLATVSLSSFGIETGAPSAAVAAITSVGAIVALAVVAVSYNVANIWGIVKGSLKLRSIALFTQILVRLYTLIALFLVQGFFPITWIASVTMFFVVVVCYLTVRRKIRFYERMTA